jgi:hypothetical protein
MTSSTARGALTKTSPVEGETGRRVALAAVLAAIALFLTFGAPGAGAAAADERRCVPKWRKVERPDTGRASALVDVAARTRNDVWAVGWRGAMAKRRPLIEHWDSRRWRVVASPAGTMQQSELRSVEIVARDDVWAVGVQSTYTDDLQERTLVEHWNGRRWHIVPSPSSTGRINRLDAVDAVSATDIWAVGGYERLPTVGNPNQGIRTLVEHWDGSRWQIVPEADFEGILYGVSARSSTDVWAVGNGPSADRAPLVLHWDGTSWSKIPGPPTTITFPLFDDVLALGANDVWAAGGNEQRSVLAHWDGTHWQSLPHPALAARGLTVPKFRSIAALSARDIWAVGDNGGVARRAHWNGARWRATPGPRSGDLGGVAAVSRNDVWAVGRDGTEHFACR